MTRKQPSQTLLVSMPWATTARPSLALGVLASIAQQRGHNVRCYEPNLEFATLVGLELAEFMSEKREFFGLAEHLFAAHLFGRQAVRSDEMLDRYNDLVWNAADGERSNRDTFREVRDEIIPGFLARTAARVVAQGVDVVGLSCTFNQVLPSLALARVLKRLAPDITVLLGGACVHGEMGEEYAAAFPAWIDHVFTGEADESFVEFLDRRERGDGRPVPGVTYLGELHGRPRPLSNMTWLPPPNFDDHFTERERLQAAGTPLPDCVNLPFESSRGCWWGAKNHCTFCGLNNEGMGYRKKTCEQTVAELNWLSERYGMLDFVASDNILQRDGYRTLLPSLREQGIDLSIFYEIKANVRRDEVAALAEAGVDGVQPGVESLSDHVLQLMNKGVSALQNVQMVKWTQEWRVQPLYNILLGFEGETDEDYEQMLGLMAGLFHLVPPGNTPAIAQVHRFSPFHADPARYGITGLSPCDYYAYLVPEGSARAERFAYFFDRDLPSDSVCMRQLPRVRQMLHAWHDSDRRLTARLGPGFVTVRVEEAGRKQTVRLSPLESLIFVATDAQTKLATLDRLLRERTSASGSERTAALGRLIRDGFAVYQNGRVLSTVPYGRPRRQRELDAWLERHWPGREQPLRSAPRHLAVVG